MSKLHIKKGDTVYVNAGEDKGRTGKVLKVFVDKRRAIVEGLNMVSKSQKPRKESSGRYCKARGSYSYFKLERCGPEDWQTDAYW